MDEVGRHARKRAEQQSAYYAHPHSSQLHGVETIEPLNGPAPSKTQIESNDLNLKARPGPTPEEQAHEGYLPSAQERERVVIPETKAEGYEVPGYRPPIWVHQEDIPGPTSLEATAQSTWSHGGPSAASIGSLPTPTVQEPASSTTTSSTAPTDLGPPVDGKDVSSEEASKLAPPPSSTTADGRPGLKRHHSVQNQMEPHLQFMAGPMLTYHTVKDGVWRGAAMIVTADAGSVMDPRPSLSLSWNAGTSSSTEGTLAALTKDLNLDNDSSVPKPSVSSEGSTQKAEVPGESIYVYHGPQGSFTFTRFTILIPLTEKSTQISYRVNHGTELSFWVPGKNEPLRWAAHSCNGFSSGVDPEPFYNHDKFTSGYDPLWEDMLEKHAEKPFHCMVGGGDQIYCDSLTFEPELQDWVKAGSANAKLETPLTDEISFAIDRYYFSHYCKIFRSGAFGLANATIPMVNMLDDHDLIDGFGSYPDDLQQSPVFRTIGSRGYFWYLLFQLFVVDAVDGTQYGADHHMKSMIIGGDGPWIPAPNHSLLVYFGPEVAMVLLDCRAERKKGLVCSTLTYDRVFKEIKALPKTVKHIVFQLGIPIAYPRMNFLEKALDSKLNPMFALNKLGMMAGSLNKFNKEAELLDDLSDHWTAADHKDERNWLVEQCQRIAEEQHVRISFLSGDVHCAATAAFYTKSKNRMKPEVDKKYMVQIVTSAIVNTPPPSLVSTMVGQLGKIRHHTLHYVDTDEEMLNTFTHDTDGSSLKHQTVMGKRNWTMVDYLPETDSLRFDIRVEVKQGEGETKGYPVEAPAPLW
ncbi:hypothetical protein BDY24DRAFT_364703 [Mrakia frigida]|uniref:uncharacterized protein n=1 Tax=Mrakia frigida TaxID=29902 RepID=UPI003FCC066E